MEIINTCKVDYMYRLSNNCPIISKTIISNSVTTQVIVDRLNIKKNVNKQRANSFDILIYTIEVCNISSLCLQKLFIKDNIPNGTVFIENSVMINGKKVRCVNPKDGFYIGNLGVGRKKKIVFKVLIVQSNETKVIRNKSVVNYDYLYNIEKQPFRVSKESNNVITNHKKQLFNQIIVQNKLFIIEDIKKIIEIKFNSKIIRTKVINSNIENSCELLVIGRIEYNIVYKSQFSIKNKVEIFGYSNTIVVPLGVNLLNDIKADVNIEDVSSYVVDKHTIFISTPLLISC